MAGVIGELRAAMDAARSAGRPWEGADALLDQALAVARDGDSRRALAMAQRARALLP